MWKTIKQRSRLPIDSNNELGMGNSVPEEKRNSNERPKKRNEIKIKLGCRIAWDNTLSTVKDHTIDAYMLL